MTADDFQVSFVVPGRALGEVLTVLRPFRIEGLALKPVVRAGGKGRAGGTTAVQLVTQCVQGAKAPMASKEIADALEAGGFSRGGVSTHLKAALKAGLIRRTAKGYVRRA